MIDRARLEAARLEKEKRDSAAKEKQELAELVENELESKYSGELGTRGDDYEIVMAPQGPVVLKLGPGVLYTRFTRAMAKAKDQILPEDVHDFVTPCVVEPEKEVFRAWIDQKPIVGTRCANALATLYGAAKEGTEKKY